MRAILLAIILAFSTEVTAEVTKTGAYAETTSVQVQARGSSPEEAKRLAFRQAIEQVVGAVVVSDQEVQGSELTRDQIGSYSAGYVDDYEVIEQYHDGQDYIVKLWVKIASSRLAQRMLASKNPGEVVNGERLATQLESQLHMREEGDALLETVLASYPAQAYVINQGQVEVKINRQRNPYVEIPYKIVMSKFWVEAFDEALKITAVDHRQCSTLTMVASRALSRRNAGLMRTSDSFCGPDPDLRVFTKQGFFPTANSYYFPDQLTLAMINEHFRSDGQPHLGLQVDLLAADGTALDSRCARIDNRLFVNYDPPAGSYNLRDKPSLSRPNIMGQNNVYGTLRVHIKEPAQFRDLNRIRLSVQKSCT